MTNLTSKTPLGTFAFIAGLGIFFMLSSPFAEFMVYQKLVVAIDATETVRNILAHKSLFVSGILAYLFNFLCDVLVAWALYFLLKPVNESLSLLTAWLQLVYAIISLVALLNLVTVLRLLNIGEYAPLAGAEQSPLQVMQSLNAFRDWWSFGFFFFGLHLLLLGYLVFKCTYIPKILGILLAIAGAGYLLNMLLPFFFPTINLDYITLTYFGELFFMIWLLVKGLKIKEPN